MTKTTSAFALAFVCLAATAGAQGGGAAQGPGQGQPATSLAQRTGGLERRDGFLPFYVDPARGRVLLEVPRLNEDLLYFVQVAKGLGNVELGIDRGAGGASKVIYFERQGNRALVVERNLRFRAPAGNAALQDGMEQSFASSILASLPIEADEGGK